MPKPQKVEKKKAQTTYYLTVRSKLGKNAAVCNKQPESLVQTGSSTSDLVEWIETEGKKDCLYTIYKRVNKDPIEYKEKWLWRNYEKRAERNGGVKEYANSENGWCKMIGSWEYYAGYTCTCCTAPYNTREHPIPPCLTDL